MSRLDFFDVFANLTLKSRAPRVNAKRIQSREGKIKFEI